MAVWCCWILAGTGTRSRTYGSRASNTCWIGEQAVEELGHFQALGIVYRSLRHWGLALSCWNTRWWWRMNGTTMGLGISSRYLCALQFPSIKCNCVRCP
jgi:hypothetical protein